MSNTSLPPYFSAYSKSEGVVHWEGRVIDDADEFATYMRDVVQPRVADDESSFDQEMRGLAATGMETRYVEALLNSVPDPKPWEIGEALAECALTHSPEMQVYWPWNTVRDRKTPRASLPGADLVGFLYESGSVFLLFGEVKTSSDVRSPPAVMNGGSGMAWQMEQSATRLDIQHALLRWLHGRCKTPPYRDYYKEAVKRYIASEGTALILVGVLLRDTSPDERDLEPRARELAQNLVAIPRIELIAWYLPVAVAEWRETFRE